MQCRLADLPQFIQRALIVLGKATFLKRGITRKLWARVIMRLGQPYLDIRFREAAYRITCRNSLIEYNLLLNPGYNGTDIDFLLENAPDDAQFVDIGSNVGLYTQSLAKARPASRVRWLSMPMSTWSINCSGTPMLQG